MKSHSCQLVMLAIAFSPACFLLVLLRSCHPTAEEHTCKQLWTQEVDPSNHLLMNRWYLTWLSRQPEMRKWLVVSVYRPTAGYIHTKWISLCSKTRTLTSRYSRWLMMVTSLLIEPLLILYVQLEHILASSLALVDRDLKVLINARKSSCFIRALVSTHTLNVWKQASMSGGLVSFYAGVLFELR